MRTGDQGKPVSYSQVTTDEKRARIYVMCNPVKFVGFSLPVLRKVMIGGYQYMTLDNTWNVEAVRLTKLYTPSVIVIEHDVSGLRLALSQDLWEDAFL